MSDNVGQCRTMSNNVGQCRTMSDNVGQCRTMSDHIVSTPLSAGGWGGWDLFGYDRKGGGCGLPGNEVGVELVGGGEFS